MNNGEAVIWLMNISADIGKAEHRDLWHYEQALTEIKEMLESAQPEQKTGKWIVKDVHPVYGSNNKCVCCSGCNWVAFHDTRLGQRIILEDEFNYCPSCGAKMEGIADD